MIYQFRNHEPPADAVRRVAREKVGSVNRCLSKVRKNLDDCVHEARKDLKKLRALARIVRDTVGEEVYQQENRCYRDAARSLAPMRDAYVRLKLVKDFRDREKRRVVQNALEEIEDGLQDEYDKATKSKAVSKAVEEAQEILKGARKRVSDWPLENELGFGLFHDGIQRAYKRGRKGMRRSLSNPTKENLHEWRKRAKYLRHQIDLLHPCWPKILSRTEDALHDLTNSLGDDHDLAVLREMIESKLGDALSGRQLQALNKEITGKHQKLVEPCWPLGRCLYAEKSKEFVRRIEAYWNSARTS